MCSSDLFPSHDRLVLDGLSATEVRKAIAVGDKKFVKRFCPKSVMARFDDISIDIRRSELKGE